MEKKRSPLQFKFLSAGPFVMDITPAGSSVVLFVLIALTPVCQFHPFAASLCVVYCFLGTRGSTGFSNSRGRIFELNSFHLGQDCPQSFLNLTPSIWVKCPHFSGFHLGGLLTFHLGQVWSLSSIFSSIWVFVPSGARLFFGWSFDSRVWV